MVVLSEHLLNLEKGANSATDNTEKNITKLFNPRYEI